MGFPLQTPHKNNSTNKKNKLNSNIKENRDRKLEIELALSKKLPVTLSNKRTFQLPHDIGKKLLRYGAVVVIPIYVFDQYEKIVQPFISITNLVNNPSSLGISSIARTAFFTFANWSTISIHKYLTDDYILSVLNKFNPNFKMKSIETLQKQYNNEFMNTSSNPNNLAVNSIQNPPSGDDKLKQVYFHVLFSNRLITQYGKIAYRFLNILYFIITYQPHLTFLGVTGGTVLIYNIAKKWKNHRIQKEIEIKKEEGEELKADVLSDFSNILSIIAKDFGLKPVDEYENTTHMIVKYELDFEKELNTKEVNEKIRKFKHFLQATPPNIFIHHVSFDRNRLIPMEKDLKIEYLDQTSKNIKKYADVHIERYFYRHPSTISQRIKRYIRNKPRFSPNTYIS